MQATATTPALSFDLSNIRNPFAAQEFKEDVKTLGAAQKIMSWGNFGDATALIQQGCKIWTFDLAMRSIREKLGAELQKPDIIRFAGFKHDAESWKRWVVLTKASTAELLAHFANPDDYEDAAESYADVYGDFASPEMLPAIHAAVEVWTALGYDVSGTTNTADYSPTGLWFTKDIRPRICAGHLVISQTGLLDC